MSERKDRLTREQYEKIERLVEYAISAPNKQEAKRYVDRIGYVAYGLQGSAGTVLSKLIASTGAAAGRIAEKERMVYFCRMDLCSLEIFVADGETGERD